MLEQQGDEQTPDAPITVEVRVDGLELHVQQTRAHQWRQRVIAMYVFLEGAQQLAEYVWGLLTISRKRGNSVKLIGERRFFTGEGAHFTGEDGRVSASWSGAA